MVTRKFFGVKVHLFFKIHKKQIYTDFLEASLPNILAACKSANPSNLDFKICKIKITESHDTKRKSSAAKYNLIKINNIVIDNINDSIVKTNL